MFFPQKPKKGMEFLSVNTKDFLFYLDDPCQPLKRGLLTV